MPRRDPRHLAVGQARGARLEAVIARRGRPGVIAGDNRTGFTSAAVLGFVQAKKLDWRSIAPGKPTRNAFAESFQGRMRDECLNEHLFLSMTHAPAVIVDRVNRLQHRAAALGDRLDDACRLRRRPEPAKVACPHQVVRDQS
jgi:transposase InsO family protein